MHNRTQTHLLFDLLSMVVDYIDEREFIVYLESYLTDFFSGNFFLWTTEEWTRATERSLRNRTGTADSNKLLNFIDCYRNENEFYIELSEGAFLSDIKLELMDKNLRDTFLYRSSNSLDFQILSRDSSSKENFRTFILEHAYKSIPPEPKKFFHALTDENQAFFVATFPMRSRLFIRADWLVHFILIQSFLPKIRNLNSRALGLFQSPYATDDSEKLRTLKFEPLDTTINFVSSSKYSWGLLADGSRYSFYVNYPGIPIAHMEIENAASGINRIYMNSGRDHLLWIATAGKTQRYMHVGLNFPRNFASDNPVYHYDCKDVENIANKDFFTIVTPTEIISLKVNALWQTALDFLSPAVNNKEAKKLTQFLMSHTKILEKENNLYAALINVNEAIIFDPENPFLYKERCRIFLGLQEFDKAITEASIAIDLDPFFSDAYCNRAIAYLSLKKFDLAVKDFLEAISLSPDNGPSYHNLAQVYIRQNRFSDAIDVYTAFINRIKNQLLNNPDEAEDPEKLKTLSKCYYCRGQMYEQNNQPKKAIHDFEKASKDDRYREGLELRIKDLKSHTNLQNLFLLAAPIVIATASNDAETNAPAIIRKANP